MASPKYPRRADNSGAYPLRHEVLRILQHARKILKEFNERQRDDYILAKKKKLKKGANHGPT